MKSLIIVGKPGAGKSHFLKNEILTKSNNFIIYDQYNYEYPQYEKIQDFNNLPEQGGKFRFAGDFWEIVENYKKLKNYTIVIEDATNFMNASTHDMKLKQLFTARRHNNNFLVFLFHSLNRIPIFVYEMSDYILLFKTKDFKKTIDKKFQDRELSKAFDEIDRSKDEHAKRMLKI